MEIKNEHGASPCRRTVERARAPVGGSRLRRGMVAATVAAACSAPAAWAQSQPDSWSGSDKRLHFGLSAPFGMAAASLAPADSSIGVRVLYGATLGALPGLAKEMSDLGRGGSTASTKDMAFNVLGAALGALVADCCLIRPLTRGDRVDGVGVEYRVPF